MTATAAELADSLVDDPDFLASLRAAIERRYPMKNQAGELLPLAAGPTGRVVVSPGQTISSSSWGNPVWDQSINCFASTADRDTQWPTPHEGSECFTVDTGSPWIYRAGAWHGRPKGYVASAVGPVSAVSVASNTTIMSLTAPVVVGRKYRISTYAGGTQQTSTGANVFFGLTGPIDSAQGRFTQSNAVPASTFNCGAGVYLYSATATGNQTWTLFGFTSAGTNAVSLNSCFILLEDMGS